ncbi:MAG: enoyl-CoA hydratase [Hyphomicrobium sp. 12-62-95]|nr:MAG: enoyl-CoA hydratase [Hyphomicrobium sp. 12-62-95]
MSGNAGIDRPPARVERPEPGVAVLFLDRPQQRNALSVAMMAALHGELATLGTDPTVAAIVIAAEGPAFCAGHDLKELTAHRDAPDGGRIFFTETMTRCAELMQAVVACPKPVIAAVHGIATAAGCQLVATCDLAVAEEDSRFATPGVNIGLFCSTPMVALARNVPRKRAMEMLLLGEMMGAAEAAEYGLVNRIVAKGEAYATALDMARIIASKSPLTVAIGKKAFYDQIDMPLGQAYDFAAQVMVENMLKADAAEGIGAFLEKRDPVWKGC